MLVEAERDEEFKATVCPSRCPRGCSFPPWSLARPWAGWWALPWSVWLSELRPAGAVMQLWGRRVRLALGCTPACCSSYADSHYVQSVCPSLETCVTPGAAEPALGQAHPFLAGVLIFLTSAHRRAVCHGGGRRGPWGRHPHDRRVKPPGKAVEREGIVPQDAWCGLGVGSIAGGDHV
jgi:hypothetical protein